MRIPQKRCLLGFAMVGVGGTCTQAHMINNSASSQVHGLSNTQLLSWHVYRVKRNLSPAYFKILGLNLSLMQDTTELRRCCD